MRERQRLEREGAILEAAQALIAEVGYDAMTMEDLAERVGISKPTLYQHFPSKEAIAIRAVVRKVESSIAFIRSLDPSRPAVERLEQIVREVLHRRFATGQTSFGTMRFHVTAAVRANPICREASRRLISLISDVVEEAKAAGDIQPQWKTRVLVQMIVSSVRDAEYEELIDSGECTTEEALETIVGVYIQGIQPVIEAETTAAKQAA